MNRSLPADAEQEILDLTQASRTVVGGDAATRAVIRGGAMGLTDLVAYLGEQLRGV